MNRLLMAAVVGAFAATAAAQVPAPSADTKAKQETVKATTEAATMGEGAKAAAGSAEAAKSKGTPKTLSKDKASRQQAVKSVTEQTAGMQTGQTSAAGSAKAAADTSPRKEKPKPKLDSPAMKEASKP